MKEKLFRLIEARNLFGETDPQRRELQSQIDVLLGANAQEILELLTEKENESRMVDYLDAKLPKTNEKICKCIKQGFLDGREIHVHQFKDDPKKGMAFLFTRPTLDGKISRLEFGLTMSGCAAVCTAIGLHLKDIYGEAIEGKPE